MTGGGTSGFTRLFRTEAFAVFMVAIISLAAYAYVFLPLLPKPDDTGGFDFSYFLPQLLAGYYWYLQNGAFAVPWFTPAFCAGVPYYGNMQGMYYSLPQFLTFVVGPTKAVQGSFLAFAAIGMGGFYLLSRRAFEMCRWLAVAGGVLFLFNGFFAARLLVGHLTFHAFMLVPLLAVCVFAGRGSTNRRSYLDIWILLGALILAYMVQSGMIHALPPSLLGIVAIILLHGYLNGLRFVPFVRLLIMGSIGLGISAAKLVAGMAFLSQFPRDMIPLSGFGSIWQSLVVALQSLFITPAFGWGTKWLVNNQWFPDTKVVLAYHEYAYGVSYVPAFIILAWLAVSLRNVFRRGQSVSIGPSRLSILLMISLILVVPILLNWYEVGWNEFLKTLPIFGNSSTLIRWICLYIPLVILISMLIVDRSARFKQARPVMALVVVFIVILHNAGLDRQYYVKRANYDFSTIETAYADARRGAPIPTVNTIEWPEVARTEIMTRRDRNEALVRGGTNAQCYEPMFGHRLEQYPYTSLRAGPTLGDTDGKLNIKNPACLQYPEANECRPGDHFASSDHGAAREFVNYLPFPFRFPWWQVLANWISLGSFLIVIAAIVALGIRRYWERKQQVTESG